jgi:hypothetical protein
MQLHQLLGLGLIAIASAPALAAPETADQISECVANNLPRKNSTQTVLLRSTNRVGDIAESRAKVFWQLDQDGLTKVLMRFEDPVDMRNAGVLLLEQPGRSPDTFLYLPSSRVVRRVSSRAASSSLFGTDFSYEDFSRLMGMSGDATMRRDEDAEVAGRPTFVVDLVPTPESGSAYERIVSFIDKDDCVPLRVDAYESGGQIRKQLRVDPAKISRHGNLSIPLEQTLTDLRDETHTDFVIESIDTEKVIHQKVFSTRELEAGGN